MITIKGKEDNNMVEVFAEMDKHNRNMLDIWLEWWCNYDDCTFEEYLKDMIDWYIEEDIEERSEPFKQALAEWTA